MMGKSWRERERGGGGGLNHGPKETKVDLQE